MSPARRTAPRSPDHVGPAAPPARRRRGGEVGQPSASTRGAPVGGGGGGGGIVAGSRRRVASGSDILGDGEATMLPRMRPETAAPSAAPPRDASPGTGATPSRPARPAAPIPTNPCRWPPSARWPAWASSARPTSTPRWSDGVARMRRRAVDAALAVRREGLALGAAPSRRRRARATPTPSSSVGAAWFVGRTPPPPAVPALASPGDEHDDTRCREAAVAALGAVGDPAGLAAVLAAARGQADGAPPRRGRLGRLRRPPRRAGATAGARADRDWQVRQAAEELLDEPAPRSPMDRRGRRPARCGCSVVVV